MTQVVRTQKAEAIAHFQYEGRLIQDVPFGNGHINDTYLLTFEVKRMGILKVILQKMNKNVFKNPLELMENILGVTSYLREKIIKKGGDPDRETLNVIPALDGKPYYQDSFGDYWRSYIFITDASSYDQVENPDQFYQAAMAFGNFQNLLADYPADTLFETIEGFHDTKARFEVFKRAVVTDIMIDNKTGKAICVIDLDTVMPGLAVNDFGDAIRFGASTGAEDEKDLSKVECSMELFDLFTKGFIEGCNGKLTKREMELLPMGAKVMTFECGMRFLTDYLQGDTYFKIHREEHNLDRCRTQFKLVSDMEKKWGQMHEIVKKYM